MKTSQLVIADPRIETCSIGKWLGLGIFQNKMLSQSYVEKLILSGHHFHVFKGMSVF